MNQLTANAIATLYEHYEVTAVLQFLPEDIRDDAKQHAFLTLLEKGDDFVRNLIEHGKLRAYLVNILLKLKYFQEDKFNRQFRKETEIPYDFTEYEIIDDGELDSSSLSGKVHKFIECELFKDPIISRDAAKDIDAILAIIAEEVEASPEYHKKVFKLYIEYGSYRKVERATGIKWRTAGNTISKVMKRIKNRLYDRVYNNHSLYNLCEYSACTHDTVRIHQPEAV